MTDLAAGRGVGAPITSYDTISDDSLPSTSTSTSTATQGHHNSYNNNNNGDNVGGHHYNNNDNSGSRSSLMSSIAADVIGSGGSDRNLGSRYVLILHRLTWRSGLMVLAAAMLWIVILLIVQGFGPKTYNLKEYSTYECLNGSHVWDPNSCLGSQLSVNGSKFEQTFPQFDILNKMWILQVIPYKSQPFASHSVDRTLKFKVSVWGSENEDSNSWDLLTKNDTHTNDMECESSHLHCEPFVLVMEEYLDYPWYRVVIVLDPSSSGTAYLGDVVFQEFTYNEEFSNMQIAFRTIYILIALAILVYYIMRVRTKKVWDWQQRWTFYMLLALVLLNDPVFSMEFVARGWTFQFIHAFFEVIFISVMISYWLLVMDVIRYGEILSTLGRMLYTGKMVCVILYASLATFFLTLVRIRAAEDPVYGDHNGSDSEVTLFYFITVLWSFCISAVCVNAFYTFVFNLRRPQLLREFMFALVPMLFIILCTFIGMFFGTFAPFVGTDSGFVFFFGLYNMYGWLIAFGNFPLYPTDAPTLLAVSDAPVVHSNNTPAHSNNVSPSAAPSASLYRDEEDGRGEGIPLRSFRPSASSSSSAKDRESILALHDNL